jgi:hypothetical protein
MNENTSLAGMRDTLHEHRPAVRLVSALFNLTGAGEQPVEETMRLAHQIFRTAVVRDGLLDLRLGTVTESPRFRLRIDGRVIDAEGCAVDLLWMALFIDKPLQLEASRAAIGRSIHVDPGPEGVRGADPPSTVFAVLDPAAPEIRQMGARCTRRPTTRCAFTSPSLPRSRWRRVAGRPSRRPHPAAPRVLRPMAAAACPADRRYPGLDSVLKYGV